MLLDVNVLLALAWPNHQHHGVARHWFEKQRRKGWATCAITELGFIRISSNPSFTEEAKSPAEASELLCAMCKLAKHRYLDCKPRPAAITKDWQATLGHRQSTDVYLARVAAHHRMKLATFDRRLSAHPTVKSATELIGE